MRSDLQLEGQAASYKEALVLRASIGPRQIHSFANRNSRSFSQKGDRGSVQGRIGMVFPGVSCTKENRRLASCFRPKFIESSPGDPQVSYGLGSQYNEQPKEGGLDCDSRHKGCLSAHSYPPGLSTISAPGVSGQSISFPGSPLRGLHSSVCLHSYRVGNGVGHSSQGGEVSPLPRRLWGTPPLRPIRGQRWYSSSL